jgi:hypothetical protein
LGPVAALPADLPLKSRQLAELDEEEIEEEIIVEFYEEGEEGHHYI